MKRTRGHVRRLQSGRWSAEITRGVRADGTPNRTYATFDTEREAEDWLTVQGMSDEGVRGVTVRVAWKSFVKCRSDVLARKTMDSYRSFMRRYWLESIGDMDVRDVTPRVVQSEISRMTHDTAKHAKATISAVLTHCVSLGVLDRNPVRGHRFDIPDRAVDESVWDEDPFAAIESTVQVWDAVTALECMDRIRGLSLEPVWLSCIGAGMRVEEAFALRGMDLRRVEMEAGGSKVTVTQAAIHHAIPDTNERKSTKTRRSVRIATYLEPFGERMWEIAASVGRGDRVCPSAASRQNKTWRLYFEAPEEMHARMSEDRVVRGRLHGLPYIPLSKMRRSHETLMQQAGVLDSVNAAMHGHSERVAAAHYMREDGATATVEASKRLKLVG